MKKTIAGKRYDTETATKMAKWKEEILYRKNTGEFFLHKNDKIEPLAYQAAQKWAERLTEEEYESIFGNIDKRSEKKVFTLSLSTGTIEKIKRLAAQGGISLSALIENLVAAAEE